jgi:hypothetical protein
MRPRSDLIDKPVSDRDKAFIRAYTSSRCVVDDRLG